MKLKFLEHLNSVTRPPLEPAGRGGMIGLDKNEAPFSLADLHPEILGELSRLDYRIYPDPFPLYEKLAKSLSLSIHNLLLTFGSDEAIKAAIQVMAGQGDEIVSIHPTFAMVEVYAAQLGVKIIKVQCGENFGVSREAMLDKISSQSKLVYVANPNMPTGSILELADLRAIAKRASEVGALFLIDEAYFPFSTVDAIGLASEFKNVVITRTFSKGWGLAGLRVGYAVADPDVIKVLRKIKPTNEVTTASIHLCLRALDYPELLSKNLDQVNKWRLEFSKINRPGIRYQPGQGNFILFQCSDEVRLQLSQWFAQQKLLAKGDFGPGILSSIFRFNVGSDDVMQRILEHLNKLS